MAQVVPRWPWHRGKCSGGAWRIRAGESARSGRRKRAEHAQHLDVLAQRLERRRDVRLVVARPRGRRRTCSGPSPCLRGRDSIRVRLTSRWRTPTGRRRASPGASEPTPQNTIAVFHGPERRRGGRRARPAPRRRAEPHEPGLVVGHVLDAGAQHLAAVALGRDPVAERRPGSVVLGDHAGPPRRSSCRRSTCAPRQPRADEAGALGVGLRVGDDDLDLPTARARSRAIRQWRIGWTTSPTIADVLGLHRERVEGRVDRALERVLDRHQRSLDVPAWTAITVS